jgi:hypothetical protein
MLKYDESGLRNVWLQNGYTVKKTLYGKAVAIQDVEGLNRLLARMIAQKPRLRNDHYAEKDRPRRDRKRLASKSSQKRGPCGCTSRRFILWNSMRSYSTKISRALLNQLISTSLASAVYLNSVSSNWFGQKRNLANLTLV